LCSAGLVDRDDAERELQVALDALAEWSENNAGNEPPVDAGGVGCGGAGRDAAGRPPSGFPAAPLRRIRPAQANGPG